MEIFSFLLTTYISVFSSFSLEGLIINYSLIVALEAFSRIILMSTVKNLLPLNIP